MNTDLRGLAPADWVARSNMMLHAGALRMNLYELRLTIDWPVYNRRGRLEVGGNRKVFRTLVGGSMATNRYPFDNRYLFFLKPSEFASPK